MNGPDNARAQQCFRHGQRPLRAFIKQLGKDEGGNELHDEREQRRVQDLQDFPGWLPVVHVKGQARPQILSHSLEAGTARNKAARGIFDLGIGHRRSRIGIALVFVAYVAVMLVLLKRNLNIHCIGLFVNCFHRFCTKGFVSLLVCALERSFFTTTCVTEHVKKLGRIFAVSPPSWPRFARAWRMAHRKSSAFANAAFACGWGSELSTSAGSEKPRAGFILEVRGCPVLWVSKLQPAIAASAVEPERAALSVALRSAMPLHGLAASIAKGLSFDGKRELALQATAHGGNQGALKLASLEEGRSAPRPKLCALRLHWLRSWLHRPLGDISASFTSTELRKADMLTKPLGPALLRANRKLSMGW